MSTAMTSDAQLLEAFMTMTVPLLVTGGAATTGLVSKVYGDWRRSRGERDATQGLY